MSILDAERPNIDLSEMLRYRFLENDKSCDITYANLFLSLLILCSNKWFKVTYCPDANIINLIPLPYNKLYKLLLIKYDLFNMVWKLNQNEPQIRINIHFIYHIFIILILL